MGESYGLVSTSLVLLLKVWMIIFRGGVPPTLNMLRLKLKPYVKVLACLKFPDLRNIQ